MNCVSKTNILNTVILNAYRTGSRTVLETLKVMHRYFLCSRQEEKRTIVLKGLFFQKIPAPRGIPHQFWSSSSHSPKFSIRADTLWATSQTWSY